MRRVAVDRLPASGETIALSTEASHHLLVVCRHPRGGALILFDKSGRECPAILAEVAEGRARIQATGPERRAAPVQALHLVLGLPKGPATDDAVRMATEVGATGIHPVWAARTQGRPNRLDRWRRIASSAAAQCGRADVPEIHPPSTLESAVERVAGSALYVAHPGLNAGSPTTAQVGAVFVGPEGGWEDRELELLWSAGAEPLDLGSWILRTPTAVAVALAKLAR